MNAGALGRKQTADHVLADAWLVLKQLFSVEVLDPGRHVFGRMGALLLGANILDEACFPVFNKTTQFRSDFVRLFRKVLHEL